MSAPRKPLDTPEVALSLWNVDIATRASPSTA